MSRRRTFLVSTTVSVVLALAGFLLILAISNDFQKSWDLTGDQRHSFSQQTEDFMDTMTEPVKFYAFVDPAGDSSVIESLLDRYQKLAPRYFSYEIVDLQKKPTLAETLQVRSYGQGVLEKESKVSGEDSPRRERVLNFDEASITNGLTSLLRGDSKTVYFLRGHGERLSDQHDPQDISQVVNSLRTEGYDAKPLRLTDVEAIPDDAAVVVMAGPSGALLDKEKELLKEYLERHGAFLFLADISTPDSYLEFLAQFGFELGDGLIIDETSASVGAEPVTPIGVGLSPDHPITRRFRELTAFQMARPVHLTTVDWEGWSGSLTSLVQTGDQSYLIPLEELLKGEAVQFSSAGKEPASYTLAAAGKYTRQADLVSTDDGDEDSEQADKPEPITARIVVTASVDGFSNASLGMAGNRDFILNSINWLVESENQITVRVKDPKVQPLSITWRSQMWLYFIFCLLLPFLSALTGLLLAYQRRQGSKD